MKNANQKLRRAALSLALLWACAVPIEARAQDPIASRYWNPTMSFAGYGDSWRPGERTVAFNDGWSAFATGYRLHGRTKTDNVVADGDFTQHGYVIGLAKRLTPNWTVGLRAQRGENSVAYHQLSPREQTATSHSIAVDVIVEDEHVVWRNTASFARDNFHARFDPDSTGDWNGTEWLFDSQMNLRWRFADAMASAFVGFRHLTLRQDQFTASDFFGTVFPAQQRDSNQVRAGLNLQWPIMRIGPHFELVALGETAVRLEGGHHPPIAVAADLNAMAGNSFTFDYATAEPAKFPSSVTYTGMAGLELRATESVHLFVHGTTAYNTLLPWHAVQAGARLLF